MKILHLTKSFPFPLKDGASWATMNLARGLMTAGARIHLASLNTDKHPADQEAVEVLKAFEIYEHIKLYPVKISPDILSAVGNLLSSESYHSARYKHVDVKEDLKKVIQSGSFDILLVESIYMMNYIDLDNSATKRSYQIILRTHNVEHLIWERYSKGQRGIKSWYFKLQSSRLKKYEEKVISSADSVLTVSDTDKNYLEHCFRPDVKIRTVPIGMDPLPKKVIEPEDRPVIFGFIGSLDWRPNLEGLNWFFDQVWKHSDSLDFSSVLMIAGRNSTGREDFSFGSGVTLLGEIEDADNFLSRIDYLIVPLLSGSGTRVKILQAFRTGTPVIATSIACEGLTVRHEEEVIIANSQKEWLDSMGEAMDFIKREQLREAGYKYLKAYHDVRLLGKEVWILFKTLISQK